MPAHYLHRHPQADGISPLVSRGGLNVAVFRVAVAPKSASPFPSLTVAYWRIRDMPTHGNDVRL
jgi:hypothetical protein